MWRRSRTLRLVSVIAVLALAGGTYVSFRMADRAPAVGLKVRGIVPVGEERCLECHNGMVGFSPAHDPATLGCVRCHQGNPIDTTEAGAHAGLIRVPGNLSVAQATCGDGGCHPGIVARVATSLMATGRGIVAVDRWVFGEQPTPNGSATFDDLSGSPADTHLRQLCFNCHLSHEKQTPGPVTQGSRGGGCVACHVQYDAPRSAKNHPALTINVSSAHCFGCHSRSGRISTNYEGWHETLLSNTQAADSSHRLLSDGRVFERRSPDVHYERGLDCIDCHTSREMMGDGQPYRHEEDQVEIACADCHTVDQPATLRWNDLDPESQAILRLRYRRDLSDRRFLTAAKTGRALINVFLDAAGEVVLERKSDTTRFRLAPPSEACLRSGHERLACRSCHSAWAPQCVGCHTQRDEQGEWREMVSDFLADAPTLGVREDTISGELRIEPFVPGMIMTLNTHRQPLDDIQALADDGSFHRLFAPSAPHTTAVAGRSCRACHTDPLALGFGRGTLTLRVDGASTFWSFAPTFAAHRDGLPADAWTPFLQTRTGPSATRLGARPFSRTEQQRILRIGACLTCHDPETASGGRIYGDFARSLTQMHPVCRTTAVDP